MNFKSFTIHLLLTTLSGGVLLQTLEAQAASITFGAWNADPFTVTKTRFAKGDANLSSNKSSGTLKAFAEAAFTDDPLSLGDEAATTKITLSNFFTVTPETGEKNGDQVRAVLDGKLEGYYVHSGQDDPGIINSLTWVRADVNAGGFARWTSTRPAGIEERTPGLEDTPTIQYIVHPPGLRRPITEDFFKEGFLTIGNTYQLNMSLEVDAGKTGRYQATSNFGENGGLTVNIRTEPTPEPLTMLASATALGFGAFFKRQHSKKPQKS